MDCDYHPVAVAIPCVQCLIPIALESLILVFLFTWTLQMIWYSVIVCHALAAAHENKSSQLFTYHKKDIWKSVGYLHKMQVSLFDFLLESHEVIWLSDFGVCQNLSIAAAYRPIRELLESEQQQVTQKTFLLAFFSHYLTVSSYPPNFIDLVVYLELKIFL